MFDQVTIIGVGLIGGSIGKRLKATAKARMVVGVGRDAGRLQRGIDCGAIDRFTTDLGTGVADADLVIIAVPVGSVVPMLSNALPHLRSGTIVTDVGSCKAAIVNAAEAMAPPDVHFVGGHPMAGSEQAGVGAADHHLFEGAYYILTPTPRTDQSALGRVRAMAETLGSRVVEMDPGEHDRAVAAVSHLPHLVASTLVNAVGRLPGAEQVLCLAAGGYRDTTRIAAGDPDMWRDIFLANLGMLRTLIAVFKTELDFFERALEKGEPEPIRNWLQEAQRSRQSLPVRTKGFLKDLYQLTVTIADRPGTIAAVSATLAGHGINIADLEIIRVREGEGGTVRLAFIAEEDRDRAASILEQAGIMVNSSQ